jgi:hypothetical protein
MKEVYGDAKLDAGMERTARPAAQRGHGGVSGVNKFSKLVRFVRRPVTTLP